MAAEAGSFFHAEWLPKLGSLFSDDLCGTSFKALSKISIGSNICPAPGEHAWKRRGGAFGSGLIQARRS
jgi:hypothetical protein